MNTNRLRSLGALALLAVGSFTAPVSAQSPSQTIAMVPPPDPRGGYGQQGDHMPMDDAGRIAFHDGNGDVLIWDPATHAFQNIGHTGYGIQPMGMSRGGRIVGWDYDGNQNNVKFWDGTGWQTLSAVRSGLGIAINDRGQIVGYNAILPSNAYVNGFFYDPANGLVVLPQGFTPNAINNAGLVVGYYSQQGTGALWDSQHPEAGLTILPMGAANDINEHGQVVGYSYYDNRYHPLLWDAEHGSQDLGTLGGTYAVAIAINDAGAVVGSAAGPDENQHAFLWTSAAGIRDISTTLDLNYGSYARGITTSGFIAGSFFPYTSNGYDDLFAGYPPPLAPTVTVTAPSLIVATDPHGAAVNFTVTASAPGDGAVTTSCSAEGVAVVPGGVLSVAMHTITCVATDAYRQHSSGSAPVAIVLQGPPGAIGTTGAAGVAGGRGADGAAGPIGPAGPPGAAGATGPVGPAGAQGDAGPAGVAGVAGNTGIKGLPGLPGATGPAGPMGSPGPVGPAGIGFGLTVRSVAANTTIAMPADNSSVIYLVTTPQTANVTMTLPPASSAGARSVTLTRVDSGRKVIVGAQGSDAILGADLPLTLNDKNASVTLVSDGQKWGVLFLR